MNKIFKRSAASLAVLLSIYVIVPTSLSAAATKVDLSTASSFGVLGALGVDNNGPTVITGTAGNMVGTTGAIAITGFPPGTAGAIHNNDAMATSAMSSANSADTAAQTQPAVAHTLVPSESVGPGAYALGTLPVLTGALTLNGGGDVNSVFIFTTNDSFTTAPSSVVNLVNGAQAANVFWHVGGTATLGANSNFVGHLIATGTITLQPGAAVMGSLISRAGAVSLKSNTITNDVATPAVKPVATPPVPAQPSRVDSVTPASCPTSGPTSITINGSFPTAITNITVNGTIVPKSDFVQTSNSIVLTSPVTTNDPVTIKFYNGTTALFAVQTYVCEPTGAVTPIVPDVDPSVPTITTGIIHVVKVVNNVYGGNAKPGDFMISLRHHGIDVVGSPAPGVDGAGRTYIVAPGTYVVGEPDSVTFPNYIDFFKINGQDTQNIVLAAGESITVTQTNTELPPLNAVVTPPADTPPPPPPTVTGGKLPKTGSPWYNFLLLGVVGMALSGALMGLRKSSKI